MTALLWTFPAIIAASVVIGWAAELTAVRLSAGIALAVLAWLQTAPEFAVEATIAWHQDAHLALANLTGSLRLLLGFGWPMIFFIHWFSHGRKKTKFRALTLPKEFRVESVGLAIPVVYFFFIYLKGTWTTLDGIVLCAFYGLYFWLLARQRKSKSKPDAAGEQHGSEDPWVVRKLLKAKPLTQNLAMLAMFVFGGATLVLTVHPFVESLKHAALRLGVSEFIFIQWIAPIASEFPEKVTAFGWARKASKVPYAIVNMLSSVTSQWTLLAGLVPIIFAISAGHFYTIELSQFQRHELLLTISQSALTLAILADLKIEAYEMIGFFALWLVQFVLPSSRETLPFFYFAWTGYEALRLLLKR
ncbi:MAG: hypothetical protein HY075_16625 [Deltaproteobacteria bacterium]|nr:hypothetical protein [Deltaproteobacteria bacterium]